jgi:predicted transposase YbfD/YdcC
MNETSDKSKERLKIAEVMGGVPNPRTGNHEKHKLVDILVIALCAMICGANDWTDVAEWGRTHQGWLARFLELANGIPSHDTFGRVFGLLDTQAFEKCLLVWIREMVNSLSGKQICVDGKEFRHSYDRYNGRQAIATVSAWLVGAGLTLGQLKVKKKGQEIAAVQDILALLELKGCVVTADALHCQTQTTRAIVEKGAEYVLPVKDNQKALKKALRATFDYEAERGFKGIQHTVFEEIHKDHGRIETRRYTVIHDPSYLGEINPKGVWWQLKSVLKVERLRQTGKKLTRQTVYAISSLRAHARKLASIIRNHWTIENGLHWRLDVVFDEDQSRVRQNHAAENMGTLRRMTLNLLQRETSHRSGINGKRLKAAWDLDYLLKVLHMA